MFFCMIYYINLTQDLDFQTWDVQNSTVADFSVELTITPRQWEKYQSMPAKAPPLDLYIKAEFE